MAIRKKVSKPVLENVEFDGFSDELKVGEKDTFAVLTEPDSYRISDLLFVSSDEDIATVSDEGEVKAISAGKATIKVMGSDEHDILDTVELTVSDESEEDDSELENDSTDETPEELEKFVTKEESDDEEEDEPTKTESKQKTNKKGGNNKMTGNSVIRRSKGTVKKEANTKSYTKNQMIDDVFERSEGFSKREIRDIITLADQLRVDAATEGKTFSMDTINFSRRFMPGRIYDSRKNKLAAIGSKDTLVSPHISLRASVEVDRETYKGKKQEDGVFKLDSGDILDLNAMNEDAKKDYDKKYN